MAKPWKLKPMDYEGTWLDLIWDEMRKAGLDPDQVPPQQLAASHFRAFRRYLLACYCQSLRNKWATDWEPLEEFSPAILLLMDRHHWRPEDMANCTEDDLIFMLHVDLVSLPLPPEAVEACRFGMQRVGITHVLSPHVRSPE